MCGRYTLAKAEHLRLKLEEAGYDFDEFSETRIAPRFNVAPTQNVVAILNESPKRVSTVRWGLVPFWAKDEKVGASMINARCETVATKPAFRSAFKKRRCLIPADGFYEWAKTPAGKIPNWFRLASGEPFYFAGLWETWNNPDGKEVRTCAIVTTGANELVAPVHNRMPGYPASRERGRILKLGETIRSEARSIFSQEAQIHLPQQPIARTKERVCKVSATESKRIQMETHLMKPSTAWAQLEIVGFND